MSGPRVGERVDRYELMSPIGRGGVGAAYRVRHVLLGSEHALKVLLIDAATRRARLMREGRLQANMRHPNLVTVTDLVVQEGLLALVMDLVRGPSIEALRSQHLTIPEIDALATGILSGAAVMHQHDTIHRDLKPANVLVEVVDGRVNALITDLGIAKILLDDTSGSGEPITRSGLMLGTPGYMAPEQYRSARRVDARADVFSLGALLFRLAGGIPAFPARSWAEAYERAQKGDRPRLTTLRPDAPGRWERAVDAALCPDPQGRPANAAELRTMWLEESDPSKIARVAKLRWPAERQRLIPQPRWAVAEVSTVELPSPESPPPPARPGPHRQSPPR